ncbi:MAG: hypothetical protein JEZ05_07905 [Tenericutes bacterium]|nr:hypothetical protein [Mycoplasmatota bacterium]
MEDEFLFYKIDLKIPYDSSDLYYDLKLAYKEKNYINEVRYYIVELGDGLSLPQRKTIVLTNNFYTKYEYRIVTYDSPSQKILNVNALEISDWNRIVDTNTPELGLWRFNLYLDDQLVYPDIVVTLPSGDLYPIYFINATYHPEDLLVVDISDTELEELYESYNSFADIYPGMLEELGIVAGEQALNNVDIIQGYFSSYANEELKLLK